MGLCPLYTVYSPLKDFDRKTPCAHRTSPSPGYGTGHHVATNSLLFNYTSANDTVTLCRLLAPHTRVTRLWLFVFCHD